MVEAFYDFRPPVFPEKHTDDVNFIRNDTQKACRSVWFKLLSYNVFRSLAQAWDRRQRERSSGRCTSFLALDTIFEAMRAQQRNDFFHTVCLFAHQSVVAATWRAVMQWVHVRCCVELLLISTITETFSGCSSFPAALARFQHFDDLKKLGTLLALSLIFTGGYDLVHSFVHWLRRQSGRQKS